MASEEDTANSAAAEEARAKAEARRKRILEKSRQRMGIVSGEQVKSTTVAEDAAAAEETAAATDSAAAASSGSARMAAMRRRRLAKKKEAAAAIKEDTTPEEAVVKKVEAPAAVCEAPAVETVKEVAKPTAETPAPSSTEASSEKRKYKGVAAMRRQKNRERAAKEAQERSEELAKNAPVMKKRAAIYKLPIIMHLLTVLILFCGGLKVGLDQVVHEHVEVHRELLAPQQHGFGVVKFIERRTSGRPQAALEDEWSKPTEETVDEFAKDDDEEYVPNIDPLFQLDLDKFTQGDSIFMVIARFAVSIHRLNLYFLYHLPISIMNALLKIPTKLINTPPLLFAFAIIVRQFAKHVLGAALPEEAKAAKKEDVLAMIKNAILSFLSTSFPTAVGMYQAFIDLRQDMFVLLCGVFVGLTWNHHLGEGGWYGGGHDEL